jgi:ABC-type multidrug transport system fused ATPase/permease subunit
METPKEDIWQTEELNNIKNRVNEYINTRLQIWKLSIIESAAKIIGALILAILLFCILLTGLIFVSAAAAIYLGHIIGSPALGFLIISLVYLVLAWGLYSYRKIIIIDPLIRLISGIMNSDNDYEDTHQ